MCSVVCCIVGWVGLGKYMVSDILVKVGIVIVIGLLSSVVFIGIIIVL